MMINRLKIRFPDLDETVANEFINTAQDRIKLRIGQFNNFPEELESICVEIVASMYNRHKMNHQGVESESVDVFSIKFVDKVLDEFKEDLYQYIQYAKVNEDQSYGKVRFL